MMPSVDLSRRAGRFPWMLWGALGMVMLLAQGGIAWLSQFFIFGEGHAERPILGFLALEGVAFAGYFFAIRWIRRKGSSLALNGTWIAWILGVSILCRLFFFSSQLIQETDPYRYIWDGQAVLQGANPYSLSPQAAFENQQTPVTSTEEAREVFRKINHSGVSTIYPPLAQVLFAAAQMISPWELTGWRILILTADLLTIVFLMMILRRLKLSAAWLVIYAWSPLVLKEFSNSLHLDGFTVFFLCAMMLSVIHQRVILSFATLAFAVLTKFSPLMLLPLLFLWFFRTHKKASIFGLGAFFAVLGVFYLPFVHAESMLFEGLIRFAGEWRVNDGLFSLIRNGIGWMGFQGEGLEQMSRSVAMMGVVIITGMIGKWLWNRHDAVDFFKACGMALATLFFFAPTGNPWYFTWILPFLVFYPSRALILFSGLALLYYLDFYFSYQGNPDFFNVVRLIEYGLFFAFLSWELTAGRITKNSGNSVENSTFEQPRKVSIILSVMNEKRLIRETLQHLLKLNADEVIVVDGLSTDGTDEIVRKEFPAVRFFQTAFPERALQMNLGAFEAQGDVFLFVHADMKLPIHAVDLIRLQVDRGYVGGGFMKSYAPSGLLLNIYAFFQNWLHLAMLQCMVGTNAMFVTRETFIKMNGFHDQPFLEDLIFSECLSRYGRIAVLREKVQVSSRRYLTNGFINQVVKNASVMIRYKMLNQDPAELREIYGAK